MVTNDAHSLGPIKAQFTEEQRIERAFARTARVFFELWEEGRGIDTRILDSWIIPQNSVVVGTSVNGGGRREHVVPCVVIVNYCIQLFEQKTPLSQVAKEIRRLLKIVHITREEARRLDHELRLKTEMPDNWSITDGNIFERLKVAGIALREELHETSSGNGIQRM